MTDKITVWVEDDSDKFKVTFDNEGNPLSVKVRRTHAEGRPWEAIHDSPFWHHSMNPSKRAQRIIKAAREKGHIPNKETVEAIHESREIAQDRDPVFEFQNGRLVKVNGMRPEYMNGWRMIALIRYLAEKHEQRTENDIQTAD